MFEPAKKATYSNEPLIFKGPNRFIPIAVAVVGSTFLIGECKEDATNSPKVDKAAWRNTLIPNRASPSLNSPMFVFHVDKVSTSSGLKLELSRTSHPDIYYPIEINREELKKIEGFDQINKGDYIALAVDLHTDVDPTFNLQGFHKFGIRELSLYRSIDRSASFPVLITGKDNNSLNALIVVLDPKGDFPNILVSTKISLPKEKESEPEIGDVFCIKSDPDGVLTYSELEKVGSIRKYKY